MKTTYRLIFAILLAGALFAADQAAPPASAAFEEEVRPYFFDRLGDLMLVGRKKELYIDRIDGTGGRKITATPDIVEIDAFFGYGGRYVVYKVERKKSVFDKKTQYKYYMQPIDDNDLKKQEIDEFIYRDLKKERIRERKKAD